MQGIRIGRGTRFAALIATRITKRITKRTARITPWQETIGSTLFAAGVTLASR